MDFCRSLEDVSVGNFWVSVELALGIVLSYVPQLVRVYRRRSSEGISPWYLLLGVTSGTSAVCNIFLLSGPTFKCIHNHRLTVFQGLAALLGLIQITLQAVMSSAMLITCRLAPRAQDVPIETKVVTKVGFTHFIMAIAVSVYVGINESDSIIQFVASLMGVVAIALALIQYFPQIYTTFMLKHAGSLSIPTMCMQTPGGFIWSASLAMRPGAQWSSWAPFLTSAMLQGTLLLMAVYYEYVVPRMGAEVAPLLGEHANTL